ncbi:cryptochrome/photolyase family protein [Neptunomonas phycophila]|uniref:cryptochrome/photolyase family protein n=1 Tax=Neptunomonas phycophila TaxID=1572645 RepID=UPI001BE6D9A6|nr:deoxyribodipyrimidine photo-lyase [Neptunomonas phycophila]MBT3147162.1 DNA photolyase family protein [Neptunomonas phycophila]
MSQAPVIFWFRQDLRLADNPGLCAAIDAGQVIPVYILDDVNSKPAMGSASRWWLHHSLSSLNASLGNKLNFYKGDAHHILLKLVQQNNVKGVYWNRCYEPWRMQRDTQIKEALKKELSVEAHSFNGSLLWEPWQIAKKDETPYKVFTPYYRKGCLNAVPPREPLAKPPLDEASLHCLLSSSETLNSLALEPKIKWDDMLAPHWEIGETGANNRLHAFLNQSLQQYKSGRDQPALLDTSRLSAPLHFGEVSPNTVWYSALQTGAAIGDEKNLDTFLSEIGWREFSYYLLYHNPEITWKNLQSKFDAFPWKKESTSPELEAWQQGRTGYPIVDAGMRELWQTGYMHNRVRMIVGSFLVKNLLHHWHLGEAWFWDTLVDADLASNSASWQWIAGCGADAAPYFRIFNPVLQGEKFDAQGEYIRTYIPELSALPNKYIHKPWEAPVDVLNSANIELGQHYPEPIVELKASRQRALDSLASTKEP